MWGVCGLLRVSCLLCCCGLLCVFVLCCVFVAGVVWVVLMVGGEYGFVAGEFASVSFFDV